MGGLGKLGSRLDRRSHRSAGEDEAMEVMDVVRNDDWEAGEFDGVAAKAARWVCRTSCWECRRRYFCRFKARLGDI